MLQKVSCDTAFRVAVSND